MADLVVDENLAPIDEIIFVRVVGIPPFKAAFSEFNIRCVALSIRPLFSSVMRGLVISANFKDRVLEDFFTIPAGINITLSLRLVSILKH